MIPKTPREILERQNASYRAMTPEQKWRLTFDLMEQGIGLARMGIEYDHPDWTHEKVDRALRRRLWPGKLCDEFEKALARRLDSKSGARPIAGEGAGDAPRRLIPC